jgi:hypothetical protein
MWSRLLGLALVGATLYAFEIPNYFNWIEQKVKDLEGWKRATLKTGLAILYFNPLWIARHLFFIRLFSGGLEQLSWGLLEVAALSFLANIPISLAGNFVIQNWIRVRWRFLASAIFSALMAIYYALSEMLFA